MMYTCGVNLRKRADFIFPFVGRGNYTGTGVKVGEAGKGGGKVVSGRC